MQNEEVTINKPCSKNYEAFELGWDTEYFGISCGKVILRDVISSDEIKEIKAFINNFEHVTINNLNNNSDNNYWIGEQTKAFLTDVNIQFKKKLGVEFRDKDLSIEICEKYKSNDRILHIAQKSFKYSRFVNDNNLDSIKAKAIYVNWAKNAFDKEGKFFVIAKRDSEIAGFLLFSIDKNGGNNIGVIELIAVDEDYRGQSAGKSLITGMEQWLIDEGINMVKVGTQVNNVNAIRFYNACGFVYEECHSIYHLYVGN